jgi:3,4-dehydroadipyl-CoA semialdehyde dehydrogenase
VLAFTGAPQHRAMLRGARASSGVAHVNVEADSLNAAVLGPDVERGSDTVGALPRRRGARHDAEDRAEVHRHPPVFVPARDARCRAGGPRRPTQHLPRGRPARRRRHHGPGFHRAQLRDVRAGIERLAASGARVVLGGAAAPVQGLGAPGGQGVLRRPDAARLDDNDAATTVHEHEVFGPVATLIPYDSRPEAVALVHRGGGGLVSSVYTDDRAVAAEVGWASPRAMAASAW